MARFVAASVLAIAAAGQHCTDSDKDMLKYPLRTNEQANACAAQAWDGATGKFDVDKFNECFIYEMDISEACSGCYAYSEWNAGNNCSWSCHLQDWCTSDCLSCKAPGRVDLARCTGFSQTAIVPCDDIAKDGRCTDNDKVTLLLSGPSRIAEQVSVCAVDENTFSECFTRATGLSENCSDCYAFMSEWSELACPSQPSKWSPIGCISEDWCTSDCLSCREDGLGFLSQCTGFPQTTIEPCDGDAHHRCTDRDKDMLRDPQTTEEQASECAAQAQDNAIGKFNNTKFNDCFTKAVGISARCSDCYGLDFEWISQTCPTSCIREDWCTSDCLSCKVPGLFDRGQCTGFPQTTIEPCDGIMA